jgi:hypothetical protein
MLSLIVEITIAVTATMVAGSLPVRLAINMPKYFLGQAAIAILYGVFPAVLWRISHINLFFTVNRIAHLFKSRFSQGEARRLEGTRVI